MLASLDVILTGLLVTATPSADEIVMLHDLGTRYTRIDYESACGSTVVRIRFNNGIDGRNGRVEHLLVNRRAVTGAAEGLQLRAASRMIDRIGIMNCGTDSRRPIFRGVMELSAMESRRLGMRSSIYFRLTRKDRGSWQISFD